MNLSLNSTHTQQAGHVQCRIKASSCTLLVLLAAVCLGSMATPVSCLQSRQEYLVCIQIAAKLCLNLALSLWAKVAHNLSIIIAFVLCTNLEVLSTLRLSRNGHSLPPFPPSLGFSLTPPNPIDKSVWLSQSI